ncbi:hypothetical protein [Bremerella cremea]|uniref:hypothetical protein n=1 Tax=Bremerella cremea TaxID=1031537 RepID=UPI0031E995C6
MIRLAIASCFVVLSAAGTASAGIWDAMTVSYPTSHTHVSSEYVAAMGAAGCGCNQGTYAGSSCSTGNCADLWSNYCAPRPVSSCRPKLHTRYHWFGSPSCGCEVETTMPCCGDYPMCGCNHGRMVKGCGHACTSCLGMNLRGFWNKCNDCGMSGCDTCGSTTEIINLEQSMEHNVPQVAPAIEPTPAAAPAKPEAKEARLLPSLQALLPRN